MAARRGKSQARRSGGGGNGLPGWAWMIMGIVLTIVVVLAAPKLLKGDGGDGFFRPTPNPDARPTANAGGDDEPVVPDSAVADEPDDGGGRGGDGDAPATAREYDFYELLPGQEVAMTDAELAASARAEEARRRAQDAEARQRLADAANPAAALPDPIDESAAATATQGTATAPAPAATAAAAPAAGEARYILQAGSFGASGDAEALKARIALLGLSARVESGEAAGRTVYRVRMGPYGTASELAEAKQKLGNGGLPALAIRSN